MATLATWQYQQDWETKIATRLDKPQNWKDVCDVRYTNTQTVVLPYISTAGEPAVTTGHFAAAADRSDTTKVIPLVTVTQSSETLQVVSTDWGGSVYVDFADDAQSQYATQMQLADLLATKTNERIEAIVLGNHAAWTNLGDDGSGNLALSSTTAFTITQANIDDVIRGIIREIQTANGYNLYLQKGGFVAWRPADWEKLVAFMQANGFQFADESLRDGGAGRMGKETMGLYHYVSTSHTAGHLMAGVRGVQTLGLLNATFGRTYRNEHPASSTAGNLSGTQIYTRLDYGLLVQTNVKPTIFDLNVA
jgi:hypothetical protein